MVFGGVGSLWVEGCALCKTYPRPNAFVLENAQRDISHILHALDKKKPSQGLPLIVRDYPGLKLILDV